AAERAERLGRNIDSHLGIDFKKIAQSAGVVSMTMRYNHKIELTQVHAHGFNVAGKDLGIVSGIEQNSLAGVFNQRCESPVFLHLFRASKGVVKNCHSINGRSGRCNTENQRQAEKSARTNRSQLHRKPPWFWVHRIHNMSTMPKIL